MFERLEVLGGDIKKGIWAIEDNCLLYGGELFSNKKIMYTEIASLNKVEQINSDVYIKIELVNGKSSNAKIDLKHYSKLYDNFFKIKSDVAKNEFDKTYKIGNDSELGSLFDHLPKVEISGLHKLFGATFIGLLIFISLTPSNNTSSIKNDSVLNLSTHQKVSICKQYIGSIMGRDKNSMKSYQEASRDTVYVQYSIDSEYWSYACTFSDDSIVWTAWLMRDNPPKWGRTRFEDEAAITYNRASNIVLIAGHGNVPL